MSASNLPEPTMYLTSHAPSGQSILLSLRPLIWTSVDNDNMPMAVGYINKNPADLNGDADLAYNDAKNHAGAVGLVSGGGAVLRYVDLAPGYTCMMHRTRSLDYGVVLDGQAECVMDGGGVQRMGRGDVMVQRYTMHAWRNPSDTVWARVVFVLLDCEPLVVGGETLRETLGRGAAFIPASDNDK